MSFLVSDNTKLEKVHRLYGFRLVFSYFYFALFGSTYRFGVMCVPPAALAVLRLLWICFQMTGRCTLLCIVIESVFRCR